MNLKEDQIIRSWHVNAQPWTQAVRSKSIASRVVTDPAIVDAVCRAAPRRVLDVGCGEGWLARELHRRGAAVLGVDAVPDLVAEARRLGSGEFAVCSYGDLADGAFDCGRFDAVVCNFSLLGENSVELLLRAVGSYLTAAGCLLVQTLHPVVACGGQPYRDGWRAGSWAGFSADFAEPAPWFFRTSASWHALLRRCSFEIVAYDEPAADGAPAPLSVIYGCRPRGAAAE